MIYTKYEKARIIGARALQLSYGAPPLVKIKAGTVEPLTVAKMEFKEQVIPLVVLRES